MNYKKEYENLKKDYDELIDLWYEAKAAYDQAKDKAKGARKALRIFGITKASRQSKIKAGTLFTEYRSRVAELSPTERTIAEKQKIIDDMAKKHGLTAEALHRHLRREKALHQKAIRELYHERAYEIGVDTFEKVDFWDEHFLPPHK